MSSVGLINEIDVGQVIESAKVNRFLLRMVALCAAVCLIDGFDTLAISYVAPAIGGAWALPSAVFGPIFAAHYIGTAGGAILFGRLADSYGRRPGLIYPTLLFGACSLLTALAFDFWSLFSLRLITGIGLGGALVNAIAMVSEFSPRKTRATLVSIMYVGFPLGGVSGGPLSALLIINFGWQAVFVYGGVVPLVLAALLSCYLPESVRFLLLRGGDHNKVAEVLSQLSPQRTFNSADLFVVYQPLIQELSPIRSIFSGVYRRLTLLMSIAAFTSQFVVVYVVTWIPLTMISIGMPITRSILASVAFSIGGLVGSLGLARVVDKTDSYLALPVSMFSSALCVVGIGFAAVNWPLLLVTIALSGLFSVGANIVLSAFASTIYPTRIRSTGVGWVVGVGRAGAVAGALFGSALLAANLGLSTSYAIVATPALLGGIAMLIARKSPDRGDVAARAE